MGTISGYVGPEAKITTYFGRKRISNQQNDVASLAKLVNRVPSNKGGPDPKLPTTGDGATLPAVFTALENFQRHHKIINRKTGKPYGWTGPRGRTIPALRRAGKRAHVQSGKVDVSQVNFTTLWNNHLNGSNFRSQAGDHIYTSNGVMSDSPNYGNINTCALRMSYALLKSGYRLGANSGSWKYQNGRTVAWLTSTAARIDDDLDGGELIDIQDDIQGEKGIVIFLGGFRGATGHVTLWNGNRCHFDDGYFNIADRIHFYPANY